MTELVTGKHLIHSIHFVSQSRSPFDEKSGAYGCHRKCACHGGFFFPPRG